MDRLGSPDLTHPRFKADPYPFYARLREEAPAYRTRWIFRLPVWLVTRYDDVLAVLTDERLSKAYVSDIPLVPRPIRALTRNLLNVDPPDHTRLRRLVSQAFTPRRINGLRSRIQNLCGELLNDAASKGRLDLVSDFALPIPLTVIADLLGIPVEDRRVFASWSGRVAAGDTGRLSDALVAWVSLWRFGRYLRRLVALRRREPREDLVTALIEAEEEGDRLDEDELVSMLGLLLVAGYETTANLIASGALALIQHPLQRDLLRNKPELAESAIEELLRYTSPADFATPRKALEGFMVGDTLIPRGSFVLPALGSANRDGAQFRDPETLDITREPNRHLAFGMGARYCLGAALARLEGQIALTGLFRRFPNLKLRCPVASLRWRQGLQLRGLVELPVEV